MFACLSPSNESDLAVAFERRSGSKHAIMNGEEGARRCPDLVWIDDFRKEKSQGNDGKEANPSQYRALVGQHQHIHSPLSLAGWTKNIGTLVHLWFIGRMIKKLHMSLLDNFFKVSMWSPSHSLSSREVARETVLERRRPSLFWGAGNGRPFIV